MNPAPSFDPARIGTAAHEAQGTAAAPPVGPSPGDPEQRLQFLFRHSLRAGRVHVLQHLIRLYRGGAQP